MFRRIGDWFRNFMIGRYGSDKLNSYLLGAGIVLMLIGSFLGGKFTLASWCSLVAYIPLLWCIFRMYSKNIEARRRENAAFLNFFAHLKDKDHRYFRCPRCHLFACPDTEFSRDLQSTDFRLRKRLQCQIAVIGVVLMDLCFIQQER